MSDIKETKEVKMADGFGNQIIIYSKHWYGRSGDVIEDLRKMLAVYTGNDIEHLSEGDIWQILTATFEEFVPLWTRQDALFDMLGKKWAGWADMLQRPPESIMVGCLAIIKGKYVDMSKQLDFFLDGQCHQFCPEHREPKSRCGCECSCSICKANKENLVTA